VVVGPSDVVEVEPVVTTVVVVVLVVVREWRLSVKIAANATKIATEMSPRLTD
jgi:hypothetical protein